MQKSEENTRDSTDSAANSSSIYFRYISTVKHIQEIIQILTLSYKPKSKCYNRQGKLFNAEMRDLPHIYLELSP